MIVDALRNLLTYPRLSSFSRLKVLSKNICTCDRIDVTGQQLADSSRSRPGCPQLWLRMEGSSPQWSKGRMLRRTSGSRCDMGRTHCRSYCRSASDVAHGWRPLVHGGSGTAFPAVPPSSVVREDPTPGFSAWRSWTQVSWCCSPWWQTLLLFSGSVPGKWWGPVWLDPIL